MKPCLQPCRRWQGELLLAAGLLIAASLPAQNCVPPPAGLVGWWPGDGNANDIAGTNNGTLGGGATADAAGVVGLAFSFDGASGYVSIPDSPALGPSNLTVEAWVLFNSLDSAGSGPSPPGEQYVVFKQNTRTNNFEGYFLGKGRASARDFFVFGVSSASGQHPELDSVATVSTGVWYHVAGARGSNFIQLYVNGQLDSQTNVTFAQDYGTNPLYFGTSGQAYWNHYFAGTLDEVSLYNRALSADEVAAIYSAGSAGKCQAPALLTQPQDQAGYWGGSAAFTASAAGASPLSYQWRENGAPVADATASSLLLTNLQLSEAGGYTLQVTNLYGSATSSVAVLTIKVADLSISLSAMDAQNEAALTIGGLVNQTYGIESAADLDQPTSWIGLTNLTLTGPTGVWYDPLPATRPQRFYRVVPGPIQLP